VKVVVTGLLVWGISLFSLVGWMIVKFLYDDWREQRACRALGREVDRMARGR
jgi:hypothetical protein